jgi:plasmid stabilization system protein ParE
MSRLEFHPQVETDLAESAEWYERQQPGLGQRFLDSAFRRLSESAQLYAVRIADIRRLNIQGFPHGIFCFISQESVVVPGVVHGARDLRSEVTQRRGSYG